MPRVEVTVRLELYFDIVSPYTYLAFSCLERYRTLWNLDLVLRPAFLGGVMKAVGNVPPSTLPQRAPYLLRDLHRLAPYFDVPLSFPDSFPAPTITTMRVLTAVDRDHPHALAGAARALFRAHWGEGKDPAAPEVLTAGLATAGLSAADVAACLAAAGDPAIKERLKATTDEVVERGAFGFPAMFVTGADDSELYFGSDRLSLLAFNLGLPWDGPVPGRRPSAL